MAKLSDPARDFTDLCLQLRAQAGEFHGPQVMGAFFEVEPWSSDFMTIMASLCQRTEALRLMISRTDLDGDIKATACASSEHLAQIAA